ncbi:MAG: M15 family metallopeptidase [Cyclobacteriaceae bacterium]|nr:M15 family metallopeptidase [Cyclobacteriaceae bacterium]
MRIRVILMVWVLATGAYAQNKYGLRTTGLEEYKSSLKVNPEKELVNLATVAPDIKLEIGYATEKNFTGKKIYTLARAYVRKPVADALKKAQAEFNKLGYGIKVFDAYRPYKATVKFYEEYHDTTYVASPYRGSRHNRGCALDMTLVVLKTGEELPMPTSWDSFDPQAWPTATVADPVIRKNRDLLISVMERNGFTVYEHEWWHFDFNGWKNYEVMDIDFEQLEPNGKK